MKTTKPLFLILALFSTSAFAQTDKGGNGGGAWVCRNKSTHKVLWAELTDVWEYKHDPQNTMNPQFHPDSKLTGTYQERAYQAAARFSLEQESETMAVRKMLNESVENVIKATAFSTDTKVKLVYPGDAHFRYVPDESSCDGVLGIEAVGNFKDGDFIFGYQANTLVVSQEIFSKFDEDSKAAFIFHEIFYEFDRRKGAKTSDNIRPLVMAFLFQDQNDRLKFSLRMFLTADVTGFYSYKTITDTHFNNIRIKRIKALGPLSGLKASILSYDKENLNQVKNFLTEKGIILVKSSEEADIIINYSAYDRKPFEWISTCTPPNDYFSITIQDAKSKRVLINLRQEGWYVYPGSRIIRKTLKKASSIWDDELKVEITNTY